jgi:hypothetical protein
MAYYVIAWKQRTSAYTTMAMDKQYCSHRLVTDEEKAMAFCKKHGLEFPDG